MKVPKYRNKKTVVDGITFDSKKEADRYSFLKMWERAGQIKNLSRQAKFVLIPANRREDGKLERACHYVADFQYMVGDKVVVEDVKGMRTKDYILKRKLMLDKHGITIREI